MSVSGALFDMVKLFDVAKIVISRYSAEKVYNDSYAWAKKYDEELVKLLENKDYALKVLGIERGNAKPRKDIAKWSDLKENISYMYNEEFDKITEFDFGKVTDKELANKISKLYSEKYFDSRARKMARTCWRYKLCNKSKINRKIKHTRFI